jgi:hypothetical protein
VDFVDGNSNKLAKIGFTRKKISNAFTLGPMAKCYTSNLEGMKEHLVVRCKILN